MTPQKRVNKFSTGEWGICRCTPMLSPTNKNGFYQDHTFKNRTQWGELSSQSHKIFNRFRKTNCLAFFFFFPFFFTCPGHRGFTVTQQQQQWEMWKCNKGKNNVRRVSRLTDKAMPQQQKVSCSMSRLARIGVFVFLLLFLSRQW